MKKLSILSVASERICFTPQKVQTRSLRYFKPPASYDHIELPERPRLRTVDKAPVYPQGIKPPKMTKHLDFIRGPELVHNTLLHKQYGIVAEHGGRLKHVHFEVIRLATGRKLDFSRMFAVWRVDAPWQPCTKRPIGMTLGGGKGNIHHYVTPVKAHRVIIEVGGKCEFIEVKDILEKIANKMPFKCRAVSQEMLEEESKKEKLLKETNQNPFMLEYLIKNNMHYVRRWTRKIDYRYFGKYE